MQLYYAITSLIGQTSKCLIFANSHDHAHYTLYNHAYFAGLIFADSRLSARTAKTGIAMGVMDLEGQFLWIPLTPRLCLMVL
jgi:hypothetical protein